MSVDVSGPCWYSPQRCSELLCLGAAKRPSLYLGDTFVGAAGTVCLPRVDTSWSCGAEIAVFKAPLLIGGIVPSSCIGYGAASR
jgi:hypothetical protein